MKKSFLFFLAGLIILPTMLTSCSKPKSILVVLTGVDYITGKDGNKHPTGYWLEEFSTPYKIFRENGMSVIIATPNGNRPVADPTSIAVDKDGKPTYWASKEEYDEGMKIKAEALDSGGIHSLAELNSSGLDKFAAVFFPGGHAPMEDLAADANVGKVLRHFHSKNKPTALVCHGTIALVSTLSDDDFPYKGYKVSAFSNSEEQFSEVGKFLKTTPETALTEAGAIYTKGPDWQSYVVEDRELITGQNPASSKAVADALVRKLK